MYDQKWSKLPREQNQVLLIIQDMEIYFYDYFTILLKYLLTSFYFVQSVSQVSTLYLIEITSNVSINHG